ncbi:MAG TPA: phosphoglycerate dehydrogenase [Longimicrobiales bacterium]|nr:phosphoglycerate dehydrogenase [Longimicrobiales bacterium]
MTTPGAPPYRLLVTDEVDFEGVALLQADPDLSVDVLPTLPAAELLERIGEYDAIVGRSATRISEALLRAGGRLKVVGRAGVGVDNVDMATATALGIAVINAPAGNTVAVAELFFGATLTLLRHLNRATTSMREGRWDRSALLGRELKGRTLGIVGLGRIGGEVAHRAHAFGAAVVAFDPYIAPERFTALRVRPVPSLEALLEQVDLVTVHTPLTDETAGLLDRQRLSLLEPGSIVVNMARGGIVDDAALLDALRSGHLGGAVLDVYATEPLVGEHPFRTMDNVVLTPHIGASTAEAQRNVAVDVCAAVRDALLQGDYSRSLNAALSGDDPDAIRPAMRLARRAAHVARALLANEGFGAVTTLTLRTGDELQSGNEAILAAAALGALEGVVGSDRVNLINARSVAASRGMALAVGPSGDPPHSRALEVRLSVDGQEVRVGGVSALDAPPRLTRIRDFHVDVVPRGTLLVMGNHDVPGVIGRVGTLLGEAGVNIAEYHQARLSQGGDALAVVSIDGPLPAAVRDALLALPDVRTATVVNLPADL